MSQPKHWEQDKEATVYVGNLDERVTDALVWELMINAGRVVNVHLPKDRVTQTHQGFGFVEFVSEEDADYAAKIMNQVRMFGKPIRVNKASADKQKAVEVGAELFVGNLDPMVDERMLYDTFSRFGTLISPPKVARDDASLSKGYGFVSYADFESSDEAITNMNGAIFMNKEVSVQYAYKKDGKGERHGDEAERTLAAQARMHNVQPAAQPLPPQLMATSAPSAPPAMPPAMDPRMMNGTPPVPPAGFAPPAGGYHGVPPPAQQRPPPPSVAPLPPPPSGLPARPPPSNAGYGGPANFSLPGFPGPTTQTPPPGFPTPPGFPAPGQSTAPTLPPGFQQPPTYNRR